MSDEMATAKRFFVHPQAICESETVGDNTRVSAFAHILRGAKIGEDCSICDHVFIENDVVIGDRVTINCGVQIWDGLRIAADVFIGPNATFSNDRHPRSGHQRGPVLETHIGRGASIGSGASILPGLRIGARAMVSAGSVVTHDVPTRAVVFGNPARIVGYVDAPQRSASVRTTFPAEGNPVMPVSVAGVTLHRMTFVEDLRGNLAAGEFPSQIPFAPKRFFIVLEVPGKDIRGEHAHRTCHQFLVCARGSLAVVVDDGTTSEEIALEGPQVGLYVPPMIWAVQYKYSADGLLLAFASDLYDPDDYIRDYDQYLRELATKR